MKKFHTKYVKAENGCWNWTAAQRNTYGVMEYQGRITDAHRISYLLHIGEIPEGMLVCHKCDNRLCVNPEHLFLGTYSDNMQDCWNKGRGKIPVSPRKFKPGHTPKNKIIIPPEKFAAIKATLADPSRPILAIVAHMYKLPEQVIRDINCNRRVN